MYFNRKNSHITYNVKKKALFIYLFIFYSIYVQLKDLKYTVLVVKDLIEGRKREH